MKNGQNGVFFCTKRLLGLQFAKEAQKQQQPRIAITQTEETQNIHLLEIK